MGLSFAPDAGLEFRRSAEIGKGGLQATISVMLVDPVQLPGVVPVAFLPKAYVLQRSLSALVHRCSHSITIDDSLGLANKHD